MKKSILLCTVILTFAAAAFAQGLPFVYSLNYFSNANVATNGGARAFYRIINPGTNGTPMSANHGTLCADIYVFDTVQEMEECCSCPITANGMIQETIGTAGANLDSNPLTGFPGPTNGVIKLISDNTGGNCNPGGLPAAENPKPSPELLSFGTHLQNPVAAMFVTTETTDTPAPLNADEQQFLGTACSFVIFLGTGRGRCSCAAEVGPGPVTGP